MIQKNSNSKKTISVHESYAQRRRPIEKKVVPHLRYNPDTLNKKEVEIELN